MKKVLWFSNTPANADEYFNSELKGTGGWLKALDQALQKSVELHVAFYGNEDKVFQHKETVYHSLKAHNSLFSKLKRRYFGSVLDKVDLLKYLSIIQEVKPDIIHIHGTENPFACIIPHCDIPVVISIQGNITVYQHKFFSGFEKRFLNTLAKENKTLKSFFAPKSFRGSHKTFKRMQARELRNLLNTNYVIGRTDWDKRITRVLAPNSIYYHGDEILRTSFHKNEWTLKENDSKITIHTTNGNNIYKGFEVLCQCLYELNNLGLECEWRVAGIKSSDLIVKITKQKLKEKFPRKGLLLFGKLNEKELVESLLDAHMYVMVSHIENSPNNLCEAMMLGMPCISTFVGGVGSLITDKQEGLLVQSGDPWAMAGAILELANDKRLAAQLGLNARKTALSRHDPKRIVEELIKTYENIITIN